MAIERHKRNHFTFNSGKMLRHARQGLQIEERAKDVEAHMIGEPSGAFYPPDIDGNIVFLDEKRRRLNNKEQRRVLMVEQVRNEMVNIATRQVRENLKTSTRITGESPKAIFQSYMQTPGFKEIVSTARTEALNYSRTEDLWKKTSGKIFEEMVYGLLSDTAQNENEVILSPKRAYQLSKSLYPLGHLVERPFDQNHISYNGRAYTPDGFLVDIDNKLVTMVMEYTKDPTREALSIKYKKFRMMKKDFPEIFADNAVFLFVFPAETTNEELALKPDVRIIRAPFTNSEFRNSFYRIWEKS